MSCERLAMNKLTYKEQAMNVLECFEEADKFFADKCENCGEKNPSRLQNIGWFCPICAHEKYLENIKNKLKDFAFDIFERGVMLGADIGFNAGRNYQYESESEWRLKSCCELGD